MAFLISFDGEPQAEANSGNDACGLPLNGQFNTLSTRSG
jgi:hypothetical protein